MTETLAMVEVWLPGQLAPIAACRFPQDFKDVEGIETITDAIMYIKGVTASMKATIHPGVYVMGRLL